MALSDIRGHGRHLDGPLPAVVEGAVPHPVLHRRGDPPRPRRGIHLVDLLQRVEPLRCPWKVPFHHGHPVLGDEVGLLVHAGPGGVLGMGSDTTIPRPQDNLEGPGHLLSLHCARLHQGVGPVFPAQSLLVADVRAPLLAAGGAPERRDLLLDLHSAVQPHGDAEGAKAEREAGSLRAPVDDPGCVPRDRLPDAPLPDLRPLQEHQHPVALPVVLRRRRVSHTLPAGPRSHDVPVGAAHEQPALRVLAADRWRRPRREARDRLREGRLGGRGRAG
mmetsp:Transcript_74664/g.218755  ORF Transcript_74664/g.218755 Transcript_74664/m.218755 type:complete len:275 (-) Transcript_74664:170-994(-)